MFSCFSRVCFAAVLVSFLFACSSGNDLPGSSEIERDLTLSSLSVDVGELSPVFSSTNPGPYQLNVGSDIDTAVISVGEPADTEGVEILLFRQVIPDADDPETFDGMFDEQTIEANSDTTVSLDFGDNVFSVRVQTDDGDQFIDYRVVITRTGVLAQLSLLALNDFATDASESITVSSPNTDENSDALVAEFDPEVFQYELSAPFSRCSYSIIANGVNRFTEVSIGGEVLSRNEARAFELEEGNNVLDIDVISEDRSTQNTYTLSITRAEPTSEDLLNNNSLRDLNFSVGDLASLFGTQDFHCLVTTYGLQLGVSQASFEVSAEPLVPGRTVELYDIVQEQNDAGATVSSLQNPRIIPSDGSVEVAAPEVGETLQIAISLERDGNNAPVANYTVTVGRANTDIVLVNNAEELQLALINAQANQQIVISNSGVLTGEASEQASGKEGVSFFSSASGTAEQPIILQGTADSILSTNANTVLELSGSFWELRDFNLSGGAQGLVLNGATNINALGVNTSGQSDSGVTFINGASENTFSDAQVSAADGHALVLGTSSFDPDAALVQNNTVSNIQMGSGLSDTPVVVYAGAQQTKIFGSTIDARTLGTGAEAQTAILVNGNDTEISYSTVLAPASGLEAAILVTDIEQEGVSTSFAENSRIFDNVLDSSDASLPFISASANVDTVFADDNVRLDGGDVLFSGEAIDQSFTSPDFAIQWVSTEDDSVLCLQIVEVPLANSALTADVLAAVECDQSNAQRWVFEHEGDGSILLRNGVDAENILLVTIPVTFNQGGRDFIGLVSSETIEPISMARVLRWNIIHSSFDEVGIANLFARNFGITVVPSSTIVNTDGEPVIGTDVFIASIGVEPLVFDESQTFILQPLP